MDCEASVIAERRRRGPSGRLGGADGAPGRTTLNGDDLPSKWRGRLEAGDVLGIETPGGGGTERPPPRAVQFRCAAGCAALTSAQTL